jgi:hypothetical protein
MNSKFYLFSCKVDKIDSPLTKIYALAFFDEKNPSIILKNYKKFINMELIKNLIILLN